ncbi:MAG: hypothetical protein IPI89_09670 [Propionivibrio sp.]|nr:hypothetical protein [Propionivibrio sp.]
MLSRVINLLVALTAITLGGFFALNYPVGTLLPIGGFVAIAVISFYQPSLFLIIIPALLPVSGFAPWTGWISFEELDLLVLATAAGGYARCAFDGKLDATQRTSSILLLLSFLMSVSILISMTRGFTDAGGFMFGWFQGYDGPMNSIRIGKSFFLALLLTPLITRLQSTPGTNWPSNWPGHRHRARHRFDSRVMGTLGVYRSARFFKRLSVDRAVLGDACRRCSSGWMVAAHHSVFHLGAAKFPKYLSICAFTLPGRACRVCFSNDIFARGLSCTDGVLALARLANAQAIQTR